MTGWSDPDTLREMSELEKTERDRYADELWAASVRQFNELALSSDLQKAAMGRVLQRCLPSLEEVRRAVRDHDPHRGAPLLLGVIDGLASAFAAVLVIGRSTGMDRDEKLKERFTRMAEGTLDLSRVITAAASAQRSRQ